MSMISEYCKICKLFEECEKKKTCSCEKFETDVPIKKPRNFANSSK